MLTTIYGCNFSFLRTHIVTCVFIIEIVHVLLDFAKTKLVHRGFFFKYIANARGSWLFCKRCAPWDSNEEERSLRIARNLQEYENFL